MITFYDKLILDERCWDGTVLRQIGSYYDTRYLGQMWLRCTESQQIATTAYVTSAACGCNARNRYCDTRYLGRMWLRCRESRWIATATHESLNFNHSQLTDNLKCRNPWISIEDDRVWSLCVHMLPRSHVVAMYGVAIFHYCDTRYLDRMWLQCTESRQIATVPLDKPYGRCDNPIPTFSLTSFRVRLLYVLNRRCDVSKLIPFIFIEPMLW